MALPDINLSSLLVYLFGGGGIIGGTIALFKFKREGDSTIVDMAKDTAEAQALVLKNLRLEITRLTKLVESLGSKVDERDQTIKELSTQFKDTITQARDEVIAAVHSTDSSPSS